VNGDAVKVSTGMNAVYKALLAADDSLAANTFYLSASGSYLGDDDSYDVSIAGAFDITQENRTNDTQSKLALEVKSGNTEVLALYYDAGKLYIDCAPYVRRGVISDFSLADWIYELNREKTNGTIKSVIDLIPTAASRFFDGCKYYTDEEKGEVKYVFNLSFSKVFASLGELLDLADIGITSTELLAALHVTDETMETLSARKTGATVEFLLRNGAFVSAKATSRSATFTLDSFSITRTEIPVTLSTALSSFTEKDPRNFSLSGTAKLAFKSATSDITLNYGVTANRVLEELQYPFTYSLTTHYVAGSGIEGCLTLKDKNNKLSSFCLKGEYLYADLTAYGIQKCKISRADFKKVFSALGLTDTDSYTFTDKIRLTALFAAGTTKSGDTVTCTLGKEAFNLLSEKFGFCGLFGAKSGTFSWSVASNELSDLSASISFPDATLSLADARFKFGTPQTVTLPEDAADYVDIGARTNTHVKFAGTIAENTGFFDTPGDMLSALLSSLGGEELTFTTKGNIGYSADILYGSTGALDRALFHFYDNLGEVVKLYYTSETSTDFYLIYPTEQNSRPVRTFKLAQEPFKALNNETGAARAESSRIFLGATPDTFMLGWNAGFGSRVLALLQKLAPDLSLTWHDQLAFTRLEVGLSADKITATLVFDKSNNAVVTATTYSVSFNDTFDALSVMVAAPTEVSLFDKNNMPTYATVSFSGIEDAYNISLADAKTGDSVWTYDPAEVPERAGSTGEKVKVTASATLLGKRIEHVLTVDITPVSSAEPDGASDERYTGVYEGKTRTFTFALYGDANPKDVLNEYYRGITLTVGKNTLPTAISSWNLAGVNTTADNRVFAVKPRVISFFGTEIEVNLDEENGFKVSITGDRAKSTSYAPSTFVAYDGRDPLMASSYASEIPVKLTSDAVVDLPVTWDLDTATTVISRKNAGKLYAYAGTDAVKAIVTDCMGNKTNLDVTISFTPKVLPTDNKNLSFDESFTNGDNGVFFANGAFLFNPMIVRSLSAAQQEKYLPSSVIVAENNASYEIKGIKWEIKWAAEDMTPVQNEKGASGTLTMWIGDSISGYQTKDFAFSFPALLLKEVAFFAETGAEIAAAKVQGKDFTYSISGVNLFTYQYPTYLDFIVSETADPDKESHTAIKAEWSFDKAFDTGDLANGGIWTGTAPAGSKTITLIITFDKVDVERYAIDASSAVDENDAYYVSAVKINDYSVNGKEMKGGCLPYLPVLDENDSYRLCFSVADAMNNKLRYFDVESYPSTMLVWLRGSETPIKVAVTWDLSAYQTKTDIVETGFMGNVTAIAMGQEFPVYVYVAPVVGAFDKVYMSEEDENEKTLNFYLLKAEKAGETYKLCVTDPRKSSSYPTEFYLQKAGSVTRTPVSILSWEGLEKVSALYENAKAGTPVNMVSGEADCIAYYGNNEVGKGKIRVKVYVQPSVLEDIQVTGIPYAASSELASGDEFYAVLPDYTEGTHGTFNYKLSLEMNPYYVSLTSLDSYPRYLTFTLDNQTFTVDANWTDWDKIPADAAITGNSHTYAGVAGVYGFPVYANIDLGLGDAFKIAVGVEVNVKKCDIEKVWLLNAEGEEDYNPYIYINGYSALPFGADVKGDYVYLDVHVQFKGDSHKYPLKLRYKKASDAEGDAYVINLSYIGNGGREGVTVEVGNQNSVWQKKSGYSIRVMANIVESVEIPNSFKLDGAASNLFFKRTYGEGGVVTDTYYKVIDIASKGLPTELTVTFSGNSMTVYEYRTEKAAAAGVVFEWIGDKDKGLGLRFFNPQKSVENIRGEDQVLYNAKHKGEQMSIEEVGSALVFNTKADFSITYGDTAATFVTPAGLIAYLAGNGAIKEDEIEAKYQDRYLTISAESEEAIAPTTVLNAGEYTLWVSVDGHGLYKGKSRVTVTVLPKNIADEVKFFVSNSEKKGEIVLDYKKAGYAISATSGDYPVNVSLYLSVNGKAVDTIRDVAYTDGKVTAYKVSVYSANSNYIVGTEEDPKTYEVLVRESRLDPSDISVTVVWNKTKSQMDVTVYDNLNEEPLSLDEGESLTYGYTIRYYIEVEEGLTETVEEFESGKTYGYELYVKIKNHTTVAISGTVTVSA